MANGRVYLLVGMEFANFRALENRWDEFLAWQTGASCQRPGVSRLASVSRPLKTLCKSYAWYIAPGRCAAPMPRCVAPRRNLKFAAICPLYPQSVIFFLFSLSLAQMKSSNTKEHFIYIWTLIFHLGKTHFLKLLFTLPFKNPVFAVWLLFVI